MPPDLAERRRSPETREEEREQQGTAHDRAHWQAYYRLLGKQSGEALRELLTRLEGDRASSWVGFRQALEALSPPLTKAIEAEARESAPSSE